MNDEKIYTVPEAAKILNWPIWKLQRAIREKQIRAFKNSERGHWHIEHGDLLKAQKGTRIYNMEAMPDGVQP